MRKYRMVSLGLAVVVAAIAVTAASAGNGDHKAKQVTRLARQVATLKTQNQQLNDRFSPAGIARQLAKAKATLDRYQSADAAKADGYAPASPCESTPADPDATSYGGGMGVHFVNPALMKPGPLDPSKPPILVYEPTAGGGFQLVAAEYFKPDDDQNVGTDGDRPTLFGRAFDGPMQGHAPGMPIHFDLHVWLWKHNPSGLFAPWNPTVSCPK
jgi:hypothetical protein